MNKNEFLEKLFTMYPNSFAQNNAAVWGEAYKEVLTDNIDFDALYKHVAANYAGSTIPKPAYLKDNAVYIKKTDNKCICFPTIYADINGKTYEFAQENSFSEARYNLEKRGFKNIRLKFENK